MLQYKAQLCSWSVYRRLNDMADKKIPKLQRLKTALSHYRSGVMKLNSWIKWLISYFSRFLSAKINKSALHPPWYLDHFWYWSHTESSKILSVENNIYSWSTYLTGFSLSTHPFTAFYISQDSLSLPSSSCLYTVHISFCKASNFSDLWLLPSCLLSPFPHSSTFWTKIPHWPKAPSLLSDFLLAFLTLFSPIHYFQFQTFTFQFNNFPAHTYPGPTVSYI